MVQVLMYHHVNDSGGSHCVPTSLFRRQMLALIRRGYRFATGTEFEKFKRGTMKMPRKTVLLTFDDGWLDNWINAFPILEELRIPAVLFAVTSWPGDGPPRTRAECPRHDVCNRIVSTAHRDRVVMRWSELEAAKGLIEIHAHSHSHGEWWSHIDPMGSLERDLRSCLETLIEFGVNQPQLAWPRGRFTDESVRIADAAGFRVQHSIFKGANRPGNSLVRRNRVDPDPITRFTTEVGLYSGRILPTVLGEAHRIAKTLMQS